MKVVQLVLNLQMGGLEKLVIQLAYKLKEQGVDSCIICLGEKGELAKEAEENGIRVFAFNKKSGFDFSLIWKLRNMFKQEKVKLVHSHNYAPLIYGSLAAFLSGIPCVNTRHSRTDETVPGYIWRLNKFILTVSDDTRNEILKHAKVDKRKVKVVYNGIDLDKFANHMTPEMIKKKRKELGLKENSFVIGNIGRLVKDKDQATLVKAFSKLVKKKFNGELVIVGDGELKQSLVDLIKKHDLNDHVKLLGFRNDISEIIHVFDAYVLSSIREGVSLTLLEAMAAGKPIVATSVGGNQEVIVDRESGYIVPCGFPERIEMAVVRLHVNKAIAEKMGQEASRRAKAMFSLDAMANAYRDIYNEVLDR